MAQGAHMGQTQGATRKEERCPVTRDTALSGRTTAGPPSIRRCALLTAVAGALALGAAGCVLRTAGQADFVYEYPVVEVTATPVRIERYPRYYYRGDYAYYVDGRWYYRDGGRWVVFRRAPPELEEARTRIVRDQRRRGPVTVVPPARRHIHE